MNLAWYGMKYRQAYQRGGLTPKIGQEADTAAGSTQSMPLDLDYNLAVYCVVEGLGEMDTSKWQTLFDTAELRLEEMDPEAVRIFKKMRERYMTVKSSTAVGWKYKVLQYFRKLFTVEFVKPVSYLLLYNLLGKACLR